MPPTAAVPTTADHNCAAKPLPYNNINHHTAPPPQLPPDSQRGRSREAGGAPARTRALAPPARAAKCRCHCRSRSEGPAGWPGWRRGAIVQVALLREISHHLEVVTQGLERVAQANKGQHYAGLCWGNDSALAPGYYAQRFLWAHAASHDRGRERTRRSSHEHVRHFAHSRGGDPVT